MEAVEKVAPVGLALEDDVAARQEEGSVRVLVSTQIQVHHTVEDATTNALVELDATVVLVSAPRRTHPPAEFAVAFAEAILTGTTVVPVVAYVLLARVALVPPVLGEVVAARVSAPQADSYAMGPALPELPTETIAVGVGTSVHPHNTAPAAFAETVPADKQLVETPAKTCKPTTATVERAATSVPPASTAAVVLATIARRVRAFAMERALMCSVMTTTVVLVATSVVLMPTAMRVNAKPVAAVSLFAIASARMLKRATTTVVLATTSVPPMPTANPDSVLYAPAGSLPADSPAKISRQTTATVVRAATNAHPQRAPVPKLATMVFARSNAVGTRVRFGVEVWSAEPVVMLESTETTAENVASNAQPARSVRVVLAQHVLRASLHVAATPVVT